MYWSTRNPCRHWGVVCSKSPLCSEKTIAMKTLHPPSETANCYVCHVQYLQAFLCYQLQEQQTLSIAKAGIICQLNARASILAAANPVDSQWNKNKTIIDNVQLPHTLLSRYALEVNIITLWMFCETASVEMVWCF